MNVKITGIGSYIPDEIAKNESFSDHQFYLDEGSPIGQENETIIRKFKAITGISERRYAPTQYNNSDLGTFASEKAIENAGIDKETIDYLIVAHNYGDIQNGKSQSDTVPSIATRIKHYVGIDNPNCVGYDLLFGCPGWIEGLIQAYAFIKAGMAKRCLVVGTETLSRVVDPHDRDSMIYSDGAGATVIEATDEEGGILSHYSATYAMDEAHFIYFGESNNAQRKDSRKYIKMYGRKIYEFALNNVPNAMKICLEKSGHSIHDIKKIFLHQANEKMDEAILKRFYKLYGLNPPNDIMPMSIEKLGNSSVATIPTLLDLVRKKTYTEHTLKTGDVVIFASVGAGMNINAFVYQL